MEQQSLISLFCSGQPDSVNLAFALEESMGVDLSAFWEDLRYLNELISTAKDKDKRKLLQVFERETVYINCDELLYLSPLWGWMRKMTRLSIKGNFERFDFPPEFQNLPQLHTLELFCNITEIGDSIGFCVGLKSLTFLYRQEHINTRLCRISEEIKQLRQLQTLRIRWAMQLLTLPECLGELSELQELSLTNCNKLTAIPDSIGNLQKLEKLNIQYSYLKQLPDTICNLNALKELHIEYLYNLNYLPAQIGKLRHLQRMSILHCDKFFGLPPSFGQLSELVFLHLKLSELKQLPENFGDLTSLKHVSLDINAGSLPDSFGDLEQLEQMDLSSSKMTTLPDCIARLPALKRFYADCPQLCSVGKNFCNLYTLENLRIQTYSPEPCKLPNQWQNMSNLRKIELVVSNIGNALPESMGLAPNLLQVNFTRLPIAKLPDDLSGWQRMTDLRLSYCQLTQLPPQIKQLSYLIQLHANNNQIEEVSENIGSLKNLKHLDLSENRLKSLPNSISQCERLSELSLLNNQLSQLPDGFQQLQHLTKLDLRHNKFTHLPEVLAELPKLTELYFSGNTFADMEQVLHVLQGCPSLLYVPIYKKNIPKHLFSAFEEWSTARGEGTYLL